MPNTKTLSEALGNHKKWLLNAGDGERFKELANLRGENLREADLSEANLRGADLSWANLRGANLREANLRGADLSWANLSEANLRGADLSWANLSEANLRGANLSWANLRWANLREADLSWANLRGADLSWANLRGANLRGANLIIYISGEWVAFIDTDYIRIGCKFHRADDWMAFSDDTISRMAIGALNYWNANKSIIKMIHERLVDEHKRITHERNF